MRPRRLPPPAPPKPAPDRSARGSVGVGRVCASRATGAVREPTLPPTDKQLQTALGHETAAEQRQS